MRGGQGGRVPVPAPHTWAGRRLLGGCPGDQGWIRSPPLPGVRGLSWTPPRTGLWMQVGARQAFRWRWGGSVVSGRQWSAHTATEAHSWSLLPVFRATANPQQPTLNRGLTQSTTGVRLRRWLSHGPSCPVFREHPLGPWPLCGSPPWRLESEIHLFPWRPDWGTLGSTVL